MDTLFCENSSNFSMHYAKKFSKELTSYYSFKCSPTIQRNLPSFEFLGRSMKFNMFANNCIIPYLKNGTKLGKFTMVSKPIDLGCIVA